MNSTFNLPVMIEKDQGKANSQTDEAIWFRESASILDLTIEVVNTFSLHLNLLETRLVQS